MEYLKLNEVIYRKNGIVSVCKGIAIILMVLGHSGFPSFGTRLIYMFHMPLFVFISGYCFNEKYLNDGLTFVARKFKRLYRPFVIWSLIFLLLHNLFFRINLYNGYFGYYGGVSHLYSLKETFSRALHIITRMTDNDELLGGLWFLKTLLCSSLIAFLMLKLSKNRGWMCILALALTSVLAHFGWQVPYFQIGKPEMYGAFFYLSGVCFRKYDCSYLYDKWMLIMWLIIVVLLSIWMPSSLTTVNNRSLIPYSVAAFGGTMVCLGISRYVSEKCITIERCIQFIGENTLDILLFHFLAFKIVHLLIICTYGMDITHLAEFPVISEYARKGWWTAYLFVGVGLPLIPSLLRKLYVSSVESRR